MTRHIVPDPTLSLPKSKAIQQHCPWSYKQTNEHNTIYHFLKYFIETSLKTST